MNKSQYAEYITKIYEEYGISKKLNNNPHAGRMFARNPEFQDLKITGNAPSIIIHDDLVQMDFSALEKKMIGSIDFGSEDYSAIMYYSVKPDGTIIVDHVGFNEYHNYPDMIIDNNIFDFKTNLLENKPMDPDSMPIEERIPDPLQPWLYNQPRYKRYAQRLTETNSKKANQLRKRKLTKANRKRARQR